MTQHDIDDAELVSRMARGDRAALSLLYERHEKALLGLAASMLGDPGEAEDLLHDVFLEAWRRAADYDPHRGSVRAWLATRTRSRALDRLKSVSRRRTVLGVAPPERSTPATLLDDHQRLRDTLLRIPEPQREVLLLAYFEDLSASEIAKTLAIPIGTVKSRLRAAMGALRAILAPPGGNKS